MKQILTGNSTGFTLIELLSAMVLAGLLVAIMMTYFGGLYRITEGCGQWLDQHTDSTIILSTVHQQLKHIKRIETVDPSVVSFWDANMKHVTLRSANGKISINETDLPGAEPWKMVFELSPDRLLTARLLLNGSKKGETSVTLKKRVIEHVDEAVR